MKIANFNQTMFGCVKIKEGGMQTLSQEGIKDLNSEINKLKEEFKYYNWDLEIGRNGYSLTSPTTKKLIMNLLVLNDNILKLRKVTRIVL